MTEIIIEIHLKVFNHWQETPSCCSKKKLEFCLNNSQAPEKLFDIIMDFAIVVAYQRERGTNLESRDKGLKFTPEESLHVVIRVSPVIDWRSPRNGWPVLTCHHRVPFSPPNLHRSLPTLSSTCDLPTDCDPVDNWWWGTGGSRGCVNVLQGGWDAIGSTLAIQLVRWWCRARDVFRADSAETFIGTLPRWPSTSKCIATRLPASSATPLSVVEPTCGVTCAWNTKYPGKKRSTGSAARKANWTRRSHAPHSLSVSPSLWDNRYQSSWRFTIIIERPSVASLLASLPVVDILCDVRTRSLCRSRQHLNPLVVALTSNRCEEVPV